MKDRRGTCSSPTYPAPTRRRRLAIITAAVALGLAVLAAHVDGIHHVFGPSKVVSAVTKRQATSVITPASPRPRPVLIYLHGMDESPLHPALADLLNAASADGYHVIFTEEGGPETWGNREAVNAIAALKARYSPDRSITLIGCSMGTFALLNYVSVAPPGSVTAAVGILPYSHLPSEHLDSIRASGAGEPAQTISIPYQMWYGTADLHAGDPTTSGPHISRVPMVGARHALPIPYNIAAILRYLDTYRAR